MKYCQYHPIIPATFLCNHCQTHCCDHCVDESGSKGYHCFECKKPTESLGARFNATPFWRRLQESFRYPISSNALWTTLIASLAMTCVWYIPIPLASLLLFLTVFGFFIKYCFSCLEETAQGSNDAPDISEAYGGGFLLSIQILAIMIGMAYGTAKVFAYMGTGAGILVGIIAVVSMPAILINLALSREFLRAINPLNTLGLITAIGLPYGLLLALIFIMLGSVTVINELITPDDKFSFISFTLKYVVSNYYSIVIFHIMGYMLFQYQGRLGFSAREGTNDAIERDDVERSLANINISIKNGEFDKAASAFAKLVKTNHNHRTIYCRCFEFLLALKNTHYITEFAPVFFRFLQTSSHQEELLPSYKKILMVIPGYQPKMPEDRLAIARACHFRGDDKLAIKLLNGLHKQHPHFKELDVAYRLMAEMLSNIKNMQKQSKQYLMMAEKFSEQKKKTKPINRLPSEPKDIARQAEKVEEKKENGDPGMIEFVSPYKSK